MAARCGGHTTGCEGKVGATCQPIGPAHCGQIRGQPQRWQPVFCPSCSLRLDGLLAADGDSLSTSRLLTFFDGLCPDEYEDCRCRLYLCEILSSPLAPILPVIRVGITRGLPTTSTLTFSCAAAVTR